MIPDPAEPTGMSAALNFLRRTRDHPALARRVAQLDPDEGLDPVLALAADAGFTVSAEDLRRAYRADWHLRRARYL